VSTVTDRELLAQYRHRLDPASMGAALDPPRPMRPGDTRPQGFHRFKHIEVMSEAFRGAVLGHTPNVIVTTQPQVGKSTMMSQIGPTWAFDKNPRLRLILASYALELAARHARVIRNNLKTRGDILRTTLAADSHAMHRWDTPEGGGLLAVGVGGPMAGFPADGLLIDDPFKNWVDANSEAKRNHVWEWWQADVLQRGARFHLITATRWHEDDLIGRLLEKDASRWHVIHIPALADPDVVDPDPLGRKPGEPVERKLFSLGTMLERRSQVNPYMWDALYQGKPTKLAGNIIKRAWWNWIDRAPLQADRDLTFTYACLDMVREKLEYVDQRHAIRAFADKWPEATHHLIENKANGPAIISDLTSGGIDANTGERWEPMTGIVAIEPDGNKVARSMRVSPLIKDGRVALARWPLDEEREDDAAKAWPIIIESEAADLPNGSSDDAIDTTTQALEWGSEMIDDFSPAQVTVTDARGDWR